MLAGSWLVPAGNTVYDFVGRHRGAFGRLSAATCGRSGRSKSLAMGDLGLKLVCGAMLLALLGKAWVAVLGSFTAPDIAAGAFGVLAALLELAAAVAWLGVLEEAGRGRMAQAGAAAMVALLLAWNLCSIDCLPRASIPR